MMPEMKDIVENIVSSYEARIQGIDSIFDTTHQILEGFQESFLDTKQEREKARDELRESLAQNESLRRKDFDNMMNDILSNQDEREKEVRNSLKTYLNEQKEMAHALGDNLSRVKHALAKGEAGRVKEFQEMIKKILAEQDKRKDAVTFKLKEFQKEQGEMAEKLKGLLAKGRELRIKDFKSMLREFNAQHKERIAYQEQRKEVVNKMLGGFNKERVEAAKNWKAMQKIVVQRRASSLEAINIDRGKSGKKGVSRVNPVRNSILSNSKLGISNGVKKKK